jgi:pilus assembly protein CpaF
VRAKVPPISPTPTISIEKGPENPFASLMKQRLEVQRWQQDAVEQIRQSLQEKLMQEIERDPSLLQERERLTELLEEAFDAEVANRNIVLSRSERLQLQASLINEILGYGPLQPLLDDPEVTEIMVNGPYQVYVERHGKIEMTSVRFRDERHLMRIIEKILLPLGKRIDERVPMVDARLPDGSRVNVVIPPISLNGPCVTIRKFSRDPFTMSDLISFGTLTPEAAQFLQAAVQAKLNILITGGTASGKTTLLNVLSAFIPNDERIITIEDTAELQLRQDHVVRLEARPPNIEGVGEVTIRDLVRNALRMRPDRIIVGECRGSEALDMLQAMNTGHEGSMTTIHANNPREALSRLETMVLMAGMDLPVRAIREQIAGAIDLIVHMARLRDGSRKVMQISEITGMEGDVVTMQDLFVFEHEGFDEMGRIRGRLRPTGLRPKCYERILERGIRLPVTIFQR